LAALRKSNEVDGFSLVKAVRHAKAEGHEPKPAATEPSGSAPPPPVEKTPARIGRTALPSKNDIFCYNCGYTFQITGQVQTLYCAKCRTILEKKDYEVEGESTADITTTGNIRVGPQAVLKGGTLIARDVILAGRMEGGNIKAFRRVELEPGSAWVQEQIVATDLRVASGATVEWKGKVLFRNVDVYGELNVDLACSGLLSVFPGGHFRGKLQGAHLMVEEGGGLNGEFRVEPGAVAVEERKTHAHVTPAVKTPVSPRPRSAS
jgi:cytoskeletal protein CcmA (bactofilin family)